MNKTELEIENDIYFHIILLLLTICGSICILMYKLSIKYKNLKIDLELSGLRNERLNITYEKLNSNFEELNSTYKKLNSNFEKLNLINRINTFEEEI